ncbi:DMT family transporter [Candidatus Caldatribacterium sp.]|uniref:DMT family transporter n=1 Tax=Candidatus Caldatribacterium sp. TaxID=2282143 RepID=UPI00299C5C4F|nr:DMT family transporter [Candidatus Caldatribacterium sp.]MDW8080966.1 DMT family transporter [Candidatus Calescibacterium sp.]
MQSVRAYLPIFGVLLFWGLSWPFSKAALQYMSPYVLSLFRFAMGAVFFLCFTRKLLVNPKILLGALMNGVCFVTLVNFAVQASQHPALASSLVYTQPLFVALLATLCGEERLSLHQGVGILLAFFGILVSAQSVHFDRGATLAIASGFLWSLGILYYRRYLKEVDLVHFNASLNFFSTIALVPFLLHKAYFVPSKEALFWGFCTACSAQVAGFFFWFLSLKTLGAVTSSTFSLLVPAFAYLFTYFIMGQVPTSRQVLGSSLTLLGVLLAQWKKRKHLWKPSSGS